MTGALPRCLRKRAQARASAASAAFSRTLTRAVSADRAGGMRAGSMIDPSFKPKPVAESPPPMMVMQRAQMTTTQAMLLCQLPPLLATVAPARE